ncbi:MAG TPA: dihydrolipoamide acetyltransferase family protein [Cyclobacteriaceae bacterium]|nr:2-oxo acid dehydrogenase subunit E2 [Cyclobacteriaceae bacterium]HMV10308.1 dihydrolipoamide acetyltransferase family protein [Cyclobacteriaceae bacterium]HMV90608.1 dihydrolipoamide acetyltransferase family protein [Cyclobacteriaceae bacterium]HMX02819.1 dihydrolipoamide acetyltransferase family protein [Cyclobacteriaceae bacterium]HMX50061.1 dihydrolipoamide acetyltransferase family protein [Cyclobacteriaceae bacterium]
MASVELIMPKMGESIMEATILSWLKKPGDKIEQDESVLEVATDKVDTEVPSTHAGVLKEILAKEGEVVKVGKPIAIITTEAEASNGSAPVTPEPKKESKKAAKETAEPVMSNSNGASHAAADYKSSNRFYSPLVKNIAKEENISVAELESIAGSGLEGRVTKKDILGFVQNRKLGKTIQATPVKSVSSAPLVPASVSAGDEIIEMDRMRKMIAERMVDSKRISPHVTSFVEADVTNIVFWRNKMKNEFQKREGDALTFTPIFIEAIIQAIKDYPMINIQVDGDRIIKKKDINIGMAVALPTGNLIVPVIRNADQFNLTGLAKVVNDLAKRARENKLKPDELSGGTFTVSNVGSFGNVMGTPIIMQPQVGIIALGAVQKKPAVIETPYGDAIAIRHKMFLSHSYDHRVVDGSLGGMVVRRVADYLEKFDINRSI